MKTPVAVVLLLSLLLQVVPRVISQPAPVACSMGCCVALPVEEHCGCVSAPGEDHPANPSLPAPGPGRDSLPQPASTHETSSSEARLRPPQAAFRPLSSGTHDPVLKPHVSLTVLFCAFLT